MSPTPSGSRPQASATIALCFLAALCEGFDVQAAGVAAAGVVGAFKPSPQALGYLFSASNLGLMIGAVVGGRLVDRFGGKAVLVMSLILFGAFSLGCSQAWDVASLTWLRLATGLGLGGALPSGIALAAGGQGAPRNRDVVWTYAGMPLGGSGVALLALATPHEEWRRLFLIGGLLPFVAAAAIALLMPRPVVVQRAQGPGSPAAFGALFERGAALRTFVLWAAMLVAGLTLHLLLNWLPLLLQWRGVAKAPAAIAQVGFSLGGALAAMITGHLLDTRQRGASLGVVVVGLPVLLVLLATSTQGGLIVGLALLLGGCVIASQGILYGVAGSLYPPQVQGTGVGAAVSFGRLGSVAGPLLAAAMLGAGRSPGEVVTGLLPIVIAGGLGILFLGWRRPAQTPQV